MPHVSTAGRLLECLHAESPTLRDAVASAAGLSADRANAAMSGVHSPVTVRAVPPLGSSRAAGT